MFGRFTGRRREAHVIAYHRVATPARDPWGLAVSPDNFALQLDLIQRRGPILPLDELIDRARRGDLPCRAVAITFDDGYLDNLAAAAPLLAAAKAPATLFLATGPMAHARAYWWDELAACVLEAPECEACLEIGDGTITIALGPREPLDSDGAPSWRAWDPPLTARRALHWELWSLLRCLPQPAIERGLAAIRSLLPGSHDPLARPMTAAEVALFVSTAPVSLGGHTVDHADLTTLGDGEAERQIALGKATIAALAGQSPKAFAYPYGHSNQRVAAQVEAAGFAYAFTTAAGPIQRTTPAFAMPRVAAQDVPSIRWLEAC